jgi:hypothetical protein
VTVSRLYSIAAGDFTGDGDTDLATVSNGSDVLDVLRGNGDGTFATATATATATAYTAPSLPVPVSAADLDGDGNTDILVSSLNGTSVTLFQGAADGHAHPAVRTDRPRCLRRPGRRPRRRRHPGRRRGE